MDGVGVDGTELTCFTYLALVLVTTTLWVIVTRSRSINKLTCAMFFPGAYAVIYNVGNLPRFFKLICGTGQPLFQSVHLNDQDYPLVPACMLATILALLEICLCAGLDIIMGWGEIEGNYKIPTNTYTNNHVRHRDGAVMGFCRVAAQEVGLRCFLLPCLMSQYQPLTALVISGVVWSLCHLPFMILMCKRVRTHDAMTTVCVHFLAILLTAFPHGWIAVRSGYSLWASTIMNFTWNRVDPPVLGNIYTQEAGFVTGKQWKIGGQGWAGCIIGIPVAILVCQDLSSLT